MRFPFPLPSIPPTARASRCSPSPWRCSASAGPARTSTSAGRCELGTHARWAAPAAASAATISSPALECPSRICILPGGDTGRHGEHRPALHRELRVERRLRGRRDRPEDRTRPIATARTASSACGRRPSATSPARSSASAATSSSSRAGGFRSRPSAVARLAASQPPTSKAFGMWTTSGGARPPRTSRPRRRSDSRGRRRLRRQVEARRPDDRARLCGVIASSGVPCVLAGARAHLDEDAGAAVVGDDDRARPLGPCRQLRATMRRPARLQMAAARLSACRPEAGARGERDRRAHGRWRGDAATRSRRRRARAAGGGEPARRCAAASSSAGPSRS